MALVRFMWGTRVTANPWVIAFAALWTLAVFAGAAALAKHNSKEKRK